MTEGIKPGILALSHHMGRWRLRYKEGVRPFASGDADSMRITWEDPGVHQNLAFAVHPDFLSGMHCWHQKVSIEPAHDEDTYGDVVVDTAKSREVYRQWLSMTRPGLDAQGLRRPMFMMLPVMPQIQAYYVNGQPG